MLISLVAPASTAAACVVDCRLELLCQTRIQMRLIEIDMALALRTPSHGGLMHARKRQICFLQFQHCLTALALNALGPREIPPPGLNHLHQ